MRRGVGICELVGGPAINGTSSSQFASAEDANAHDIRAVWALHVGDEVTRADGSGGARDERRWAEGPTLCAGHHPAAWRARGRFAPGPTNVSCTCRAGAWRSGGAAPRCRGRGVSLECSCCRRRSLAGNPEHRRWHVRMRHVYVLRNDGGARGAKGGRRSRFSGRAACDSDAVSASRVRRSYKRT